jgi:hypothetical protein
MVDPQDLQEAQTNPTPTTGLVPGAGVPANPAGILSGAPDLATAVAQAYLTHLTRNQPPPTQAVQQQAAAKAAANQPVDTSAKPAGLNGAPATSSLGGSQSQPDAPARPGSFGSKLAGAFDAASAGLGDAAHASDTRGGWLTGITNTLNARNQRLAQQQKDQVLQAKTQAETVEMHRNMYRQATADRQAGYAGNQNYVDTMSVNHETESGITDAQLRDKMKDKNFADNYYVRATSEDSVLDPKTGKQQIDKKTGDPIFTPTYTIINRATTSGEPDNIEITPEMSADAKRLLGNTLPPKTRLTTEQYTALDGQINLARNAVNAINTSREKPLTDDEVKAIQPYLNDPTIRTAVAHKPGNVYAGLVDYQQNADAHIADWQQKAQQAQAAKNQNAYDEAQANIDSLKKEKDKVTAFATQVVTPKEVKAFNDNVVKSNGLVGEVLADPTKLQGHAESVIAAAQDTIKNTQDPAVKAQAQRVLDMATNTQKLERQNKIDTAVGEQTSKDAAAKVDNNPNGLTGDAYIKTLPPGRANMLRAMSEGRLVVNPSAFERSAAGKPNQLADDMYAAYPDFNATLGAEWPKAYTSYMINGQDHKKATAFNTVMEHSSRLYDNTTLEGVTNPNSKAYQDRQEEMSFVTRELGNAVSSGVLAQSEAEDVRKALQTNWPTLDAKREKVREAVRLLDSKMKAMQDGFDATAPSAAIKVPKLQSAAATAAHDHVLGLNEQQTNQGSGTAPAAPKGGTNPMVSADGKTNIWLLNNQWVTADGKPYKP